MGGTNVSNPKLLSSIEILSDGTVVKDYILAYTASTSTSREELTSVTECTDSTKSTCLSPTNIGYQTGSGGVSTTVSTALSSSGSNLTARYDLNGDGIPDLVYYASGSWRVAFGSTSGYGTPVNTGITATTALIGNLNAASQDGILANNGGTWYYYAWNGSAFSGATTHLAYDSTASQYQLADVNGDGFPDLIALYVSPSVSATVTVRLNTTSSTSVTFSSTTTTGYTQTSGIESAILEVPDNQFGKLRHYDFDGDGRDDLVLTVAFEGGTHDVYREATYELISQGTTFSATVIEQATDLDFLPVYFANWNDDACTDYVYGSTLYISGCNGTVATSFNISGTILAGMDWDGDGRTDLLVSNGTTIGVYKSTGSGVSATLLTTSVPYSSTCTYVAMDASGDGLDDLGCWNPSTTAISYYAHNGITDLATAFTDGFGNSAKPTYVSIAKSNYTQYHDATAGYMNYIGPLYVVNEVIFSDPSGSASSYNQTYWYYGAWMNLQGRGFQSFYGTRMIDSRNGFYYFHYYERAFPETGMDFEDVLSNNDGAYINVAVRTPTINTLSGATNEERYFPYFSNVKITQEELGGTEDGKVITTTSTDYGYDSYGNATSVVTTLTDSDPNSPFTLDTWTTSVTNTMDVDKPSTQSADLAAWCLTMPDQTQIIYSSSLSGSSSVTRTQTYGTDTASACRIKTITTEPGGAYTMTEGLTFDSFGNIQTDTLTGANVPTGTPATRVTTLNWGTTGQFLTTLTDPSNATTTWTYASSQSLTYGVPDYVIDANALKTSWGYDQFGRKTKETRPDSTSTTWTWSACSANCGFSNSVYQIAQAVYPTSGTTAIRTDTSYYDPIDRKTETQGPTVTGATAIVQTTYDSLGRLATQTIPFLSGKTSYQQTWSFDLLNRLTSFTRPINQGNASNTQSTSYQYAGRTVTVTDPNGNNTTIISDVNGWLRWNADSFGYTVRRAYDAAGSLTGMSDTSGNTTLLTGVTYVYGIKPFMTAAQDADLGAWTYTVDAFGERTAWTDAKGQSFSMSYDALSRPTTRTDPITTSDPGLFTQWTYGSTPASHNVGQLTSECTMTGNPTSCGSSPQYSESRTFDGDGRLSTRSITENGNTGNDGSGAFLFTYGYSTTTGLPSTLTYPKSTSGVALNLQYAYTYGLLQSVTDTTDTTATCGSSCTLWTATAMDSFGHVTGESLGNGVVTARTYDAVTSWLTKATAGVGGGAGLLNQSYLQDYNGNVKQRQDGVHSLTESFSYDADNRLTCVALSATCTTATIVYDGGSAGPSNITSQTGVGTYTYDVPGTARPHAVVSIAGTVNGITNPQFAYDANGNMTQRASSTQNVYWYSYNYPASISATDATGSEEVQFTYGPDRQRWKQIYTGPSVTENTYYVGGLMDVVYSGGLTDYRHYIYAGKEPVAVYSRTSSSGITMRYLLQDHLGSIAAITTNAGALDIGESFSAFGQRRNPTTWSGAPANADLSTIAGVSRQGYTFQTWLGQSMGLNHMNGRVQDAITGQMLSPDPYITNPNNPQSYNRYAYATHNPLNQTDPSGFIVRKKTICLDGCSYQGSQNPNFDWNGGSLLGGDDWDTSALTNSVNSTDQAIQNVIQNALGSVPAATANTGNGSSGDMATGDAAAQSQNPGGCVATCQSFSITVIASRNTDTGLSGADFLGAGLGIYSAVTDSFYTAAGIRSASFFGVKYGLPAVLSDIPGGVGGAIGVFQTFNAYGSGDYLGASQAGGATLGGIGGAELGAFVGAFGGPFDFVTVPVGAVAGGVIGGYYGGQAGASIFNTGFMPLDRPSVPPPPPAY